MRLLSCVTACMMIPAAAAAQSPAIGQWTISYSLEVRNLHSGGTRTVDESGVLSLHARGDSITGFWQPTRAPGEPAAAVRAVRGTSRGDSVRVQVDFPPPPQTFFGDLTQEVFEWLKTHVHDMPTTTPVFDLLIRGDSIAGTRRTVTVDGEMRGTPVKVTGVRRRD